MDVKIVKVEEERENVTSLFRCDWLLIENFRQNSNSFKRKRTELLFLESWMAIHVREVRLSEMLAETSNDLSLLY